LTRSFLQKAVSMSKKVDFLIDPIVDQAQIGVFAWIVVRCSEGL